MRRFPSFIVITGTVAFCLALANQASACWCNRVYTSYYIDPCVSCSTTPPPCVTSCSTAPATCSTGCADRCYLEPQTSYRVVTRLEPQTFYVRRSYYDPLSFCQRSYYAPATQFVERSYQVPVTSYVQRCYSEPSNACPTSYSQPGQNGKTPNSDDSESQPSDRSTPGRLDRPIYRERTPTTEPPPKPVPMPSPESARSRSTTARAGLLAGR